MGPLLRNVCCFGQSKRLCRDTLGTEKAQRADKEIDRKNAEGSYELTDEEREEKKRLRQANGNAYINLQLSLEELPYNLVPLAKTEELPDGCARNAWEKLASHRR